jgi:hypothetical protein
MLLNPWMTRDRQNGERCVSPRPISPTHQESSVYRRNTTNHMQSQNIPNNILKRDTSFRDRTSIRGKTTTSISSDKNNRMSKIFYLLAFCWTWRIECHSLCPLVRIRGVCDYIRHIKK